MYDPTRRSKLRHDRHMGRSRRWLAAVAFLLPYRPRLGAAPESSMAVDRIFEKRLASLINRRNAGALRGGLKGVEKESLRVSPDGHIARTPHPRALGSALTNEHITTDYSEVGPTSAA
jgi:hypothetical protein